MLRIYYKTFKPKDIYFKHKGENQYTNAGQVLKQSFLKNLIVKIEITLHSFGRSYATHLIENGVGLRHVQDLLGHSKPETTMIYTHIARKDLLRIESVMDSAFLALTREGKNDKGYKNMRLSRNIDR